MGYYVEEICTEKTLDIMKAIDTEVYGFVTEIEWYRDRYLGTAKVLVVSNDNGVVVGYAAFVGLKTKAYKLMREGYISGDFSLSPKAYTTARDSKGKIYLSITISGDDSSSEKLMVEALKTSGICCSVLCIVEDYSLISKFQIGATVRTMSGTTEVAEVFIY